MERLSFSGRVIRVLSLSTLAFAVGSATVDATKQVAHVKGSTEPNIFAVTPNTINLQNDPLNCGAVGEVCSKDSSCIQGSCVEQVINLENDPQNCGAIGTTCSENYFCNQGACVSK